MFHLALFVFTLVAVSGSCEIQSSNKIWERNDKMLITLDLIYDSLAIPIRNDVCNAHKRSFSIICQLMLRHVHKSYVSVSRASKHARRLVREPTDVIAADVRRSLDMIRTIIDGPINDVKRYCRPNENTTSCEQSLQYHTALQTLKCPFYTNHVRLWEDIQTLLLDEHFQKLLEGAMQITVKGDDSSAVDFFIKKVLHKKIYMRKMHHLYKKYEHDVFPCLYSGSYKEWQTIICPKVNKSNKF